MLGKKLASVFMAAALAATLSPMAAMASPLAASDVVQPENQVTTQAAKKTVYLLKGYSYTANGLVKGRSYYGQGGLAQEAYTYDAKNNFKTFMYKNKSEHWQRSYKYTSNSKGVITKAVCTQDGDKAIYTYKYDNKGRVKSVIHKVTKPGFKSSTNTYVYDKNGHVIKSIFKYDGRSSTTSYAYDSKGGVKKMVSSYGTSSYANTYDSKGNLKSRVTKSSYLSQPYTVKYQYTMKKVPASLAAKVQAQQWALVNQNLNNAFLHRE